MCKCKKCNKKFKPEKGLKEYCSLKCRNSRNWNDADKLKKSLSGLNSEKVKAWGKIRSDSKIPIIKKERKKKQELTCEVCNKKFMYKVRKTKTCSKKCGYVLISRSAINRIVTNGTWQTKKDLFQYKGLSIETDSKLEKASIIYLKDYFNADKIERFKSIINFKIDNVNHCYNPDFYVVKNNKIYIVEVKMKWSNSEHTYYKTLLAKKEALSNYCKEKEFEMIWLDFDYDKKLKEIYKQFLHIKGVEARAVSDVCKT